MTAPRRPVGAIVRDRLAERGRYGSARDWALGLYDRVLRRLPRAPLPGRGRACSVRLAGASDPVRLRLGTTDWHVLEEVFFGEEYGPLVERVRDARAIVDLGANVGMTVRLWQQRYPRARVVAVEPDADSARVCGENVLRGPRRGEVEVVVAAVAGRGRVVRLDRRGGAWAYRMVEGDGGEGGAGGEPLRAMTVPEILERANLHGRIDILKCDVEGAEAELFEDCGAWLPRVDHLAVEVHAPYTVERLLAALGPDLVPFCVRRRGDHAVVHLERRGATT